MNKQRQAKAQKAIEGYNIVLNLIWSFVFLYPVVVFCYTKMDKNWFIISILISIIPVFLPTSFLNAMQVSQSRLFYEKAGLEYFNEFIQNGAIINRFIKKKFPDYKRFRNKNEAFKKLFNQTYMFEKFHFVVFIFFLETAIFAVKNRYFGWAIFLIISNIIYNVYPILLQQYIRLRLNRFKQ